MALFKKGGAIASDRAVKFSADALEKRLKNLGIDPKVGAKVNALKKPVKEVIEEVQEGDFEIA